MNKHQVIENFVTLAIQSGGWMEMDRIYLQNRLMDLINESTFDATQVTKEIPPVAMELVEQFIIIAKENGVLPIEAATNEQSQFVAQLMDFLTPPPSVVNAMFSQHYNDEPQVALDYFYTICLQNHQVEVPSVSRTDELTAPYPLNLKTLSTDLPAKVTITNADYPKCSVCMTNEGYSTQRYPIVEHALRFIRLNLLGDSWFFRFAPVSYQKQQAIFLSEEHSVITRREKLSRMIQLVDVFSSYMIGFDEVADSNLIEKHSYLEGANQLFPIESAKNAELMTLTLFPTVTIRSLIWNQSALSLSSSQPLELLNAMDYVVSKWINDYGLEHQIAIALRKNEEVYTGYIIFTDERLTHARQLVKQGFNGQSNWFDACGAYVLSQATNREVVQSLEQEDSICMNRLDNFITTL
ncbi:hypothetical protein CBF34_11105 [Vagococcus penaei]|uniref:Galactose-1-phosphate uridyl transferase N-terminal domain-containing protein n=1 Tax=Vagococcus penaei TaxID=633807 RepID=A0A1Q2D4H6_9ENTE|nr:hypothetical protein [Vagococcus penaei]AQP53157.1 hypothetical protein BW732_02190 [Vagococcus penaei]RST97311.1 hypothetical protein CBF34_11105 [Vagococcus penaei]